MEYRIFICPVNIIMLVTLTLGITSMVIASRRPGASVAIMWIMISILVLTATFGPKVETVHGCQSDVCRKEIE